MFIHSFLYSKLRERSVADRIMFLASPCIPVVHELKSATKLSTSVVARLTNYYQDEEYGRTGLEIWPVQRILRILNCENHRCIKSALIMAVCRLKNKGNLLCIKKNNLEVGIPFASCG